MSLSQQLLRPVSEIGGVPPTPLPTDYVYFYDSLGLGQPGPADWVGEAAGRTAVAQGHSASRVMVHNSQEWREFIADANSYYQWGSNFPADISGDSPWSIYLWFNLDATPDFPDRIFTLGSIGSSSTNNRITISCMADSNDPNSLRLNSTGGDFDTWFNASVAQMIGRHSLAFTYAGGGPSALRAWLDGVELTRTTTSGTALVLPTSTRIVLGHGPNSNGVFAQANKFNGALAAVQCFDYEHSDAQVTQVVNWGNTTYLSSPRQPWELQFAGDTWIEINGINLNDGADNYVSYHMRPDDLGSNKDVWSSMDGDLQSRINTGGDSMRLRRGGSLGDVAGLGLVVDRRYRVLEDYHYTISQLELTIGQKGGTANVAQGSTVPDINIGARFGQPTFPGILRDFHFFEGATDTLTHRYFIDDNVGDGGTIKDSVGNADGILHLGGGSWQSIS